MLLNLFFVASINLFEGKIFFCNYKSLRYEIRKTEPEKLARLLIAKGFQDGDDVTEFLTEFIKDGENNAPKNEWILLLFK